MYASSVVCVQHPLASKPAQLTQVKIDIMQKEPGTFSVSTAVELAVTTRGDFIESRHAGSAIVLSSNADTLLSLGDPTALIFTRSSLKPLQSLAMHAAGLQLADSKQMALSLASHSGTGEHVAIVRQMLSDGELDETQLQCPADYPADIKSKHQLLQHGASASPIYMCCSGKHAAMLRTCQAAGWDTANYTDPEHPLQQHIYQQLQRYTGETPQHISVDGCGAPVFAHSLAGLARGYRRMAAADPASPFPINRIMSQLLAAGRAQPQLVEGPAGQDTIVMQHAPVFSKFGAEGVCVMAAADGTVAAVKMLDGSSRASRPVTLALLAYVGAVSKQDFAAAIKALPLDITGGGKKVGEIRVSIPTLSAPAA